MSKCNWIYVYSLHGLKHRSKLKNHMNEVSLNVQLNKFLWSEIRSWLKVLFLKRLSTPNYILPSWSKVNGTPSLCLVGGRCNVCHESLNGTLRWHMNQHLQKYETSYTTNLFIHFVTCILSFIYHALCYHTHNALMFIFKDVNLVDRHWQKFLPCWNGQS